MKVYINGKEVACDSITIKHNGKLILGLSQPIDYNRGDLVSVSTDTTVEAFQCVDPDNCGVDGIYQCGCRNEPEIQWEPEE